MSEIFSLFDHQMMAHAIKLAKKGWFSTSPNPRVGCVIAKNGRVIAEGYHQQAGENHAEINALAAATEAVAGSTVYVTLEPCSHYGRTPPCAKALIAAKVAKVIVAMVDPNPLVAGNGLKMLAAAGIEVQRGLLEAEAKLLNVGFIKRMQQKSPWVQVKLAASLDGKTAMANGDSKWITSAAARMDVQKLRAQSCAILCGSHSVIQDGAKMTVRQNFNTDSSVAIRQPLRVVIDTQHKLTPELPLFAYESPILIVRTQLDNQIKWPHFVEQVVVAANTKTGKVDLKALLMLLAERGMNHILVEAGATLAGAIIHQNLADELVLYQAPKLLGGDARSLVTMPDVLTLNAAKLLTITNVRQVGEDIRIQAKFHH